MASIHKEISIEASAEKVWAVVRDVGAVHRRFVPGLVTDVRLETGARVVTDGLSRELGKPVVIENRGGGGVLNGAESLLAGELDGHTILLGGIAPLTIIP